MVIESSKLRLMNGNRSSPVPATAGTNPDPACLGHAGAGLRDVHVLDGGLTAWTRRGGALAREAGSPSPGDVTVRPGGMPTGGRRRRPNDRT
ncbi:hypothetical protein [Frankia sp. Cppng1_Ct_nod]|uniref:hypothetical protein n=1 Tax=Frankia sp. Cppng1_Ct_nod TaxID=2897162 RepID=UPI00104132BA|nr:hypothetical protein [Frankia sp. Cppng1_Ct_nod]